MKEYTQQRQYKRCVIRRDDGLFLKSLEYTYENKYRLKFVRDVFSTDLISFQWTLTLEDMRSAIASTQRALSWIIKDHKRWNKVGRERAKKNLADLERCHVVSVTVTEDSLARVSDRGLKKG